MREREYPGGEIQIANLQEENEYYRRYYFVYPSDGMTISGSAPSSAFGADSAGAPNTTGSWVNTFLNARAGTIYAGSSQVQRNIIGEMVLGLPKEPRPK